MYDVFVSYARADGSELALRIVNALERRSKRVWFDTEDIPPAVTFTPEIQTGIEGSDAFAIVVTEHSMSPSSVCQSELEHAILRGKRIVPVRRVVGRSQPLPESTPQSIRDLNVIGISDSDEFEQDVDLLETALELNLPWIREHTRLLLRAIDWLGHERGASWLLRGDDLVHAEQWLASTPSARQPTPVVSVEDEKLRAMVANATPVELQRALITASRTQEDLDHDATVGARFVVLARSALERGPSYLPLATRLAIESMVRAASPTCYELLNECRQKLTEPIHRISHTSPVTAVAAGPDHLVATCDATGEVRVSSSQEGKEHWVAKISEAATWANFSADGQWLATGADTGRITVWNTSSHERVVSFDHPEQLGSLMLSTDGRFVLSTSGVDIGPSFIGPSSVRIFDLNGKAYAAEIHHDQLAGALFHTLLSTPNGPVIVAASNKGAFRTLDVHGATLAEAPIGDSGDWPVHLAASPAQPWVALTMFSGVLHIIDLTTGLAVADTQIGTKSGMSVFGPGGSRFAALAGDGSVIVWEIDGWTVLARVPAENAHTVMFGADDNTLIVVDWGWGLRVWQVAPLREIAWLSRVSLGRLAVSPDDGTLILAHEGDCTAWVMELTPTNAWQPHATGSPTTIALDSHSRHLLIGGERPDPSTPWISAEHPRPGFAACCNDRFGDRVVVETSRMVQAICGAGVNEESAHIVDSTSASLLSWKGGPPSPYQTQETGITSAAASVDGSRLVLCDGAGTIFVRSLNQADFMVPEYHHPLCLSKIRKGLN